MIEDFKVKCDHCPAVFWARWYDDLSDPNDGYWLDESVCPACNSGEFAKLEKVAA